MRRKSGSVFWILAAAVLLTACGPNQNEDQITQGPTATLPPAPAALSTEALEEVLPTSTPEPQPTATPQPSLPAGLERITYRTFEQLEELVVLPYQDVIDLDFSPDHRYLRLRQALPDDAHRDIFLDLETWEEALVLEGGQRVYFGPAGLSIAALDGGNLAVYDLETGEVKMQFNSRNEIAALSPDGRTIVEIEAVEEGTGTTFRVVDLATEEERNRIFINGELEKASLQFDDDGRLLAADSFAPPNTYISTVWNLRTGRVIYSTYGYREIALHPFGSEIAISNAKQSFISLVSTVSWQQKVYLGPAVDGPAFHDLAYSAEGRLISALIDGEDGTTTAQFWYPPSGEQLSFPGDPHLLAVAVSPDLQLLAASHQDGPVTLWGVPE